MVDGGIGGSGGGGWVLGYFLGSGRGGRVPKGCG